MMVDTNVILQGNCIDVLKTLPDESVDCVMTSPPYWALRDYGVADQLGLEPTFQEYIARLCDIFDEVKRVLKKEGTCWVNLADTYANCNGAKNEGFNARWHGKQFLSNKQGETDRQRPTRPKNDLGDKNLCNIPARFSIAMQDMGWILRNEIIWHKPNCMPCSVTDRFTVDFEKLFLFSKSKRYYFEQQYSKFQGNPKDKERQRRVGNPNQKYALIHGNKPSSGGVGYGKEGRNMRCVWSINTKPFKEAHFATYPEELCETPLRAGCPIGGIVLDPFFGAGTTGLVALKQHKRFIGIELNPEYITIANKRLRPYLEQQVLI